MTSPQQGVNLGSAYSSIVINDNIDAAISRATGQFDNALNVIGGKMQALGSQMSNIGGQITLATAPLALFGGASVQAAASFEDAMAEIQARAGLTDEAMKQISATALELGSTTAFSAQEAADGFLMLLTAGLDVEEALATLPAVLTGAAAAGADLGQTTEQVTNIMSSFGLEVTDVTRIVETMNQAAGASPAEMSEMGEALALVGGDAQAFGLSLEQTGAILTIFARNGKVGSEAATQLRSILTQMTADTEDSNRAWDMVNSSLFDANGNTRDFGVVLAEVKAGLENLNAEDAAFVINQLAGSYGRVGFNALLASEGIDPVIDQMGEQASAAEVAEARLDTLNGRFDAMMDSIKAGQIIAFTPFNEWLKTLIERATEVINVFTAWIDKNQEIVQPILKVVAVLLLIGPALLALGPIVGLIGSSLSVLGVAIGALLSPIGLVVAAVVGLAFIFRRQLGAMLQVARRVVGFVAEAFNILVFRDFKALGSGLQEDNPLFNFFFDLHDRVKKVVTFLGRVFGGIGRIIRYFVNDLKSFGLEEALRGIFGEGRFGETMQSSLEGVLVTLGMTRDRAIEIVDSLWQVFEPVVNVIGAVSDAVRVFFNNLGQGYGIFDSLQSGIMTFAGSLGITGPQIAQLQSALSTFFGAIETGWAIASTGLQAMWTWFTTTGMPGITNFINNVVIPALVNLWSWLQEKVPIALQTLAGFWTATLWPALQSVWNWIGENLLPGMANLWAWLQEKVPIAIATLAQYWTATLWPALQNVWNWIETNVLPQFGKIVDWMIIHAPLAIQTVADLWNNTFSPAIKTAWSWLQTFIDIVGGPEFGTYLVVATGLIYGLSVAMGAVSAAIGILTLAISPLGVALIAGGLLVLAYQNNWLGFKNFIDNTVRPAIQRLIEDIRTLNSLAGNPLGLESTMNIGPAGHSSTPNADGSFGGASASAGPQSAPGYIPPGSGTYAGGGFWANGGSGSGQVAPGTVIQGFATGTNYVPHDMIAMLHEGESVTPKEFNPAAGGSGGGMNFNGANFTINANSYAEGAAAARGFKEQIEELMRST